MKYKCLKFFLSPKSGQAGLGGGDDRWPRRPKAEAGNGRRRRQAPPARFSDLEKI